MKQSSHLRIARPTDQLELVSKFYIEILGFEKLGEFRDHEGFDGVMVGHSDAPFHLEFTHAIGHCVGSAPSKDHLLIFYISESAVWNEIIRRITDRGVAAVPSLNPFWDRFGKTIEDPDGYRIVIQNSSWPPGKSA